MFQIRGSHGGWRVPGGRRQEFIVGLAEFEVLADHPRGGVQQAGSQMCGLELRGRAALETLTCARVIGRAVSLKSLRGAKSPRGSVRHGEVGEGM